MSDVFAVPTVHPRVTVERSSAPAGRRHFAPRAHHVVRIHVGAPVPGACDALGPRTYRRGEIDLFLAGSGCEWEDATRSESLFVHLPVAFVERVTGSRALRARHKFRDGVIEHLAWALADELAEGGRSGPAFAEGLAMALTARLGAAPHRATDPLAAAFALIDAQLAARWTVADLARAVGVSASTLKRLFRARVGGGVHAYVVRQRVARARELLAQGGATRAELALATGFAHQSHLARWLRRS